MAAPPRLLIAGGYGVFGRLLARELLVTTTATLVIAGRDKARAHAACRELGGGARLEARQLDLNNDSSLSAALAGCQAVLCAAGPFQSLVADLPGRAVRAGVHWLDIGDDRDWVIPLLTNERLHEQAGAAGVAVLPGLSTVPALSGMLARWLQERYAAATRARITLFIGNRNAKGGGAIASALESGFGAPVAVDLPLGTRRAYRFASADEELLPRELGLAAEFRVTFEWELVNRLVALAQGPAARLGLAGRQRLARSLSLAASPFSGLGSDAGCLQVELFDSTAERRWAALTGHGQRLAILPCALAAEALLSGELQARGVISPATWLTAEQWRARLVARDLRFSASSIFSV